MLREISSSLPEALSARFQAAFRMGGAAAGILLRHFSSHVPGAATTTKAGVTGAEGLVTVADLEAERAILEIVRSEFPADGILAEESGHTVGDRDGHSGNDGGPNGDLGGESEFTWVIDPLDGTNNFAHGIPQFSISIACCRNGRPALGIVIDPIRDDWFVAVQGQGAWHNGKRVHVSRSQSLAQSMVGVGFYYDRGAMMRATLQSIGQIFEANVLGVRRFGSAALDLVNVGLGRFGGYFEYTLSPWDFAAGMLFVTEAGGRVSDCRLETLTLKRTSVLATNGLLHDVLGGIVSRNCPVDV